MKLKHFDDLNNGDILVINSETGLLGAYKIGERFIFESFNMGSLVIQIYKKKI